jgi:hypothetical protein
MKALSIKQPWAELILQGKKTIELRKWNTKFRGEFFIHASGNVDWKACERFGLRGLSLQCLVGKARLVSVVEYEKEKNFLKSVNKHLASSYGDLPLYGFVLKNVKRIKPIKVKGALGFFDV